MLVPERHEVTVNVNHVVARALDWDTVLSLELLADLLRNKPIQN
jgi:hypothetical protein